jgi:hypothetical protein
MILELKSKYSNFILINTLKEISSDTQKSLLQTLDEHLNLQKKTSKQFLVDGQQ